MVLLPEEMPAETPGSWVMVTVVVLAHPLLSVTVRICVPEHNPETDWLVELEFPFHMYV